MNTVTQLAASDLFGSLSEQDLEALDHASALRELKRNDLLFAEGDEASDLYMVVEGKIAIARESFDGRESVLALMDPGDLFGEMPLFDDDNRSADARALETSTVLAVPYGAVRSLYDRRPELLWRVVGLLSSRLRSMDDALADAMFLDVPGRTAKRLLEMSGGQERFRLPITQEELAGMVGASRERVNKAMAQFVRLGWLEQQHGTYQILNREAMLIRSR